MSDLLHVTGLVPCPFCRGRLLAADGYFSSATGRYQILCLECESEGPVVYGTFEELPAKLREAWNRCAERPSRGGARP